MTAAGDGGFEGLMAALLSRVTGDHFFVARSGDQPADALSRQGVAIQAKRYDKKSLDETNFEGDYNKACREFPELDAYVLAATRHTAQLEALSRKLEESHGVDIFLVGLAGATSPLAALCVTFWNTVRPFFSTERLPAGSDAWAAAEAAHPDVAASVERLRAGLLHSIHTAENTRRKLDRYRARRFGLDTTASWPNRFAIDLNQLIGRRAPLAALDAWWHDPARRAAILTAEEGMGKSWVAAAFAQERARQDEALVLWLDSADWAGQTSLSGLVEAGLMLAGVSDQPVRKRLARKALRRWSHRLLIVLDGINERGARTAAHHLLAELLAPDDAPARLLFTSRPVSWASDEKALWAKALTVPMAGFTEQELREALQHLPTPVAWAELSAGLTEIASIPRYFQRAIALRARFRSLNNVSKETVLWAELLEKIANRDPQVAERIAWESRLDAQQALLRLTEGARQFRNINEVGRGYRLLLHAFGNDYRAVRQDLADQRIVVDPTGDDPRPSPAHIRLGFALHLGDFLRSQPDQEEVGSLADALKRELEPLSGQDDITEALFVALQLSALTRDGAPTLTPRKRAALLLAWATSHNARIESSRLQFWAREDEATYLDFLETLFVAPVSGPWTRDLLQPLGDRWRDTPDPASVLGQRLCRWLKLVWIGPGVRGHSLCEPGGHVFPFAKTKAHLDLSKAALAVFSEAPPVAALLPDFVLAWASDEICAEDHHTPARMGRPAKIISVRCKGLNHNLGPYFRWHYTERIKPSLATLKAAHPGDALIAKACDEITGAFDVLGWQRVTAAEEELMKGESLFVKTPHGERASFHEFAHLAVREDLPTISDEDSALVAQIMEEVFAQYGETQTDSRADMYLAWFARYHSGKLLELGTGCRPAALARAEEYGALEFANDLPYDSRRLSARELLDATKVTALRIIAGSAERHRWNLGECHVLALFCFGEEEQAEWFEFAAQHPELRRQIHFYPTPLLIPFLCHQRITNAALQRAVEHIDAPAATPKQLESEFEYWAGLAGYTCDPDDDASAHVAQHLDTCPPGNWQRFHMLLIYFRSLSDEALSEAFASGGLLHRLDAEGRRAFSLARRAPLPWQRLPRDFEFVVGRAGLNVAGSLFAEADHTDELRRWGEMLFAKASQLLDVPTPARRFWGRTVQYVDARRRVIYTGCELAGKPAAAPPTPLRPKHQGTGFLDTGRATGQCEASENDAVQLWIEDVQRLEALPEGVLRDFEGAGALAVFRDLDPKRFRELAMAFLDAVMKKPLEAYHLDGFVHAAAVVLMPLEPDHAAAVTRELKDGHFRSECMNEHGVAASAAAAWAAAQAGNPRCAEFCRTALRTAANDKQLMDLAITAQAEGAGPLLASLCDEWLGSPLAKERCLAVSLLPWLLDGDAGSRLAALARDDLSGWVRDHAQWAGNAARQEAACRRQYRRVLDQSDANAAKTLLTVLRPALTPAARWWQTTMPFDVDASGSGRKQVLAAITLFWQRVNSVTKSTIELHGRKLEEHLRGEKIANLRSPALLLG